MKLTGTLTVRGPDLRRYITVCTLYDLEVFIASHPVERVDIYRNHDGSAQVGIGFESGATTIFDVDSFTAATVWNARMMAVGYHSARMTHIHYQTKRD